MEPPNNPKADLEVMGVSRSGRVRKKSSKLMDFQSPDEIEPRSKKLSHIKVGSGGSGGGGGGGCGVAGSGAHHLKQNVPHITGSPIIGSPSFGQATTPTGAAVNPAGMTTFSSGSRSDDDLLSTEDFHPEDNEDSLGSVGDTDDVEAEHDDDVLDETHIDPTVRQSIYMTEKANKKKIMKDGKIVYGKAQRKDKGKTRFTAYMQWAKDVRKQMLAQQPDLDFASISRRLGEMWANVPMSEKYIWKRRAKRLANKAKATESKEVVKSTTKFLNRGAAAAAKNRSKKASESSQNNPNETVISSNHEKNNSITKKLNTTTTTAAAAATTTTTKTNPSSVVQVNTYKVTGIDPLDVAAHLRLLGESLSIIGERLKEHEGQITVSGSLSVLLDSLLCSLGPLMCLTTQIPGVDENNRNLRESLQHTLDNIAYVMPGL